MSLKSDILAARAHLVSVLNSWPTTPGYAIAIAACTNCINDLNVIPGWIPVFTKRLVVHAKSHLQANPNHANNNTAKAVMEKVRDGLASYYEWL
jgi:hypothetical protein